MIAAVHISLQFGGQTVLKDVSFMIRPRDRFALVGANGAGKTTLLRILRGDIEADAGEVSRARYVTVGYLPQEGVSASGRTLREEAESVFQDVLETENRLASVQRRMGEVEEGTEEFHELLDLCGELQHRLELSDAFRMKAEVERVLSGLGFGTRDFARPVEEFSGGWQMRIALARLLLEQPSLLLLDEPTNHLDLDSLRWLEDYLRTYQGALCLVSHDTRFLDLMTTRTLELSRGTLTEYAGNFSAYLEARAERREQQQAAFKNQQQQIRQTERFIERFRYKATKARQVQSRIKQLEKLERVELESDERGVSFAFPAPPPSGKVAMQLRGIAKHYGSIRVFGGVDLEIDRGDRMAFVGVNGAGKSTLARIIAGVETPDAGERIPGHNVIVSYFAQHQAEELNPALDVLGTVESVATGDLRKHLRDLLGCFLFSGDDVFKSVRVLSGGEKSRLALAKMLLQPANLLVLDEPTNHLDVRSKAVLQDALLDFDGSYVIVSHDRDFLDPLITAVVEFREGHLRVMRGSLSDYLDLVARREKEDRAAPAVRGRPDDARERKRLEAEARQWRYRHVRPVREELERLEASIAEHERRRLECERLLGDPALYTTGDRAREVTLEFRELERLLAEEYGRWTQLSEELERLTLEQPPPGSMR